MNVMSLDRTIRLAAAALLLLVVGVPVSTQTPPALPAATRDAGQPFRASATAIVVDVVVRDRKGAPVLDLKAPDFELLEDGVPQTIGAVTLVAPTSTGGRPSTRDADAAIAALDRATGGARPEADGPTVIALVFHRLSAEARALAYRAALAYLDTPPRPNDYAGVFLIDQRLETIQTYTSDRAKVRAAIDDAASRATSLFDRGLTTLGGGARGDRDASVSPTASAESPGRTTGDGGYAPRPAAPTGGPPSIDGLLERVKERMEEQYQQFGRVQDGNATTSSLLALVNSLNLLPGRKTVVFLAERLSIPTEVQQRFASIVDSANRANVSIYTMDAAGLRVHSEQAATGRAIAEMGFIGTGDTPAEDADSMTGGGSLTRRLEKNEFMLRQDPHASLGTLAEQTGGFLIDNNNDLASAFGRIDADRRFHYLVTYAPTNTRQDGTFRRITVTVRRRNVEVRARSGYTAVAGAGTVPTLQFETAALAALAANPRRTDIPIRAQALLTPTQARPGQLAIVVTVPGAGLTYYLDQSKTSYWSDFTILTQILDAQRNVVRKGSQPYRLTGPADRLEAARQGDVLFYRQPELPAGRYTLEYVVSDALGAKAGTGSLPLVVEPANATEPMMSSLVIVGRAERVPESERDPNNPLYVGDVLLYPNLGTPLSKSRDGKLSFFYTLFPRAATLRATLELVSGGRSVATVPLTLPAADATGRVQHLAQLPLASLAEGSYTVRITLNGWMTPLTRDASFTLAP
jgi:VWFA-related protein